MKKLILNKKDFGDLIGKLLEEYNSDVANGYVSKKEGYNAPSELFSCWEYIEPLLLKNTAVDEKLISIELKKMLSLALSAKKQQCYVYLDTAFSKSGSLFISYKGYAVMAKRYGMVDVTSGVVYNGEEFKVGTLANGSQYIKHHDVDYLKEKKEIDAIGAYALATMASGVNHFVFRQKNKIKEAMAKDKYSVKAELIKNNNHDNLSMSVMFNEHFHAMMCKSVTGSVCRKICSMSDNFFDYSDIGEAYNSIANKDNEEKKEIGF